MKKSAVFLLLFFILLGFFACQIPKAVEIIGTPSAKFAETVDIGKIFADLLRDAINKDERLTIIPCPETEIITYLIHAELLNKEFDDLDDDKSGFYEIFPHSEEDQLADDIDTDIPLADDKILFSFDSEKEDPENRLIVPLSELGLLLPGFEFYDGKDAEGNDVTDQEGVYKTKLYFSGSQIVEKSKIIIKIGKFEFNEEEDKEEYKEIRDDIIIEKDKIDNEKSDIDNWKISEYDENSCPDSGVEIEIPITGEDIAISFKILIPKGELLEQADFKDCNINVEIVVWLPFKFIAKDEEGAALHFPDGSFFSSEDDLFGREEPDSDSLIFDIFESISVDVKFHDNPFMGADLIISSKGIDIHNLIENDWLSFTITQDNMDAINEPENWPFIPDIKIGFVKGEKLTFPRVFNAVEFAFKAKVRYRIDL